MLTQHEINKYIAEVLASEELAEETERIRRLLVGLERTPHSNKAAQIDTVQTMTQIFRALLKAKEIAPKR